MLDDLSTGSPSTGERRRRALHRVGRRRRAGAGRGRRLRGRVPPGRAQCRAAIGRAPAGHRHGQHPRHAHRAGRARTRACAGSSRHRRRASTAARRSCRRPSRRRCCRARRTRCRSSRASTTAACSPSCTGSRPSRCATSTSTGRGNAPTRSTRRSSRCSSTRFRTASRPIVHGDGQQSRDFTYITDVVAANLAAATAPAAPPPAARTTSPVAARALVARPARDPRPPALGRAEPEHTDPRPGDVRHTLARHLRSCVRPRLASRACRSRTGWRGRSSGSVNAQLESFQ